MCVALPLVMRTMALLLVAASLSSAGCVTQGKYDQAVSDARTAQTALAQAKKQDAIDVTDRDRLKAALDAETKKSEDLRASLATANGTTTALAIEKQSLASSLDKTQRAQASAEARARFFHALALKLKTMIDAGQLRVAVRDGRMVLQLPTDVLFASGQSEVRASAKPMLKQVAEVLKTLPDRDFQIAGHTDNVPIDTDRFPSNWELSSARALEVVRLFVANGMSPTALSAAAYGEFDPVSPNVDEKGRARNRRIEITVQPNIDELVSVPDNR